MKQAGEPGIFYEKRYITIPMLILLLAPTILESSFMGAEFVHLRLSEGTHDYCKP